MRSVQKKSSHCYNKNSLHDIHVTWQPRRVDWTCTHEQWQLHCTSQWGGGGGRCHWVSLCTMWPLHSKWLSRATNLHQILEHHSTETIGMIQKAAALGNWWLGSSSWQHACSCITSHAEFFGETSYHPGDSARLQPRFGTLWFLPFPKTKITFEREETSDHW